LRVSLFLVWGFGELGLKKVTTLAVAGFVILGLEGFVILGLGFRWVMAELSSGYSIEMLGFKKRSRLSWFGLRYSWSGALLMAGVSLFLVWGSAVRYY
jgi:hypothetical protein